MREQVWLGILDTERLARYYQRKSDRLRRRNAWLSFSLIISSTAAMASLVSQFPELLASVFLLLVVGLALWLRQWDYSGKATAANLFCDQYVALAVEWRRLWYGGDATEDDIYALQERQFRITLGYGDLAADRSLNLECEKEADEVVQAEFQAA